MSEAEKDQPPKYGDSPVEAVKPEEVEDIKKTITVDTVHGDEAVKVLASYNGDQIWTEPEEKKLLKKIDRRLLSILVTTYGLQYYDKAMLSQAVRSLTFVRIQAMKLS